MDIKKQKTKLTGIKALSSMVVLFLVLCMSMLPGSASASSGNNTSPIFDHLQDAISNLPQYNDTFYQSASYLIAEVNYKDDTLNLIDPRTDTIISTMPVGYGPLSVVPCPGTMTAAVLHDNNINDVNSYKSILIVNMSTKVTYRTIPLMPGSLSGIGDIDKNSGSIDHMFFRNDGKYLYVVTDTYLAVINMKTYVIENYYNVPSSKVSVGMSQDGSQLIMFTNICNNKYVVDRLNTTTNQIEKSLTVTLDFSAKDVGPLVFSPDGSKAYAFIDDMGLTGWIGITPGLCIIDTDTLAVELIKDALPKVHYASSVNRMDLEISPDGTHLYMLYSSGSRGKVSTSKILTYNLATMSSEETFESDCRTIGAIALSPDGNTIYVANYGNYWARENTIGIMDAASGEITGHLTADDGPMDVKVVKMAKQTPA